MAHNEPILKNGERMYAGQFLTSRNGLFHALMEDDGNFVIYRGDSFRTKLPGYEKTARWRLYPDKGPAGGTGYHIYMQTDGNLCIYRQNPQGPMWCSPETHKNRRPDGRFLELYDDGWLDIRGIVSFGSPGEGHSDPEWESIQYILEPPPKITPGPPGVNESVIGHNGTSVAQNQDFSVTYQKTTTTSWKIATSLKIGAKTTFETGLPHIVEGKIETSVEFTTTLEWNKTTSETQSVTIPLKINVPPHKSAQAKVTWRQSSLKIPYRLVGKVKFDSYPDKLPVYVEGVYDGVTTHDIETYWKELPGDGAQLVRGPHLDDEGWKLIERVKP